MRKLLRRVIQGVLIALGAGAALLFLYGAALFIGASIPTDYPADALWERPVPAGEEETLFFINNGYHVEFCLPASSAPQAFLKQLEAAGSGTVERNWYLCFGWGDRKFYPQTPFLEDLSLPLIFPSLFLPTKGALRVVIFPGQIQGEAVTAWKADRSETERLYQYIADNLVYRNGGFLRIPPDEVNEVYGDSLFLHAKGSYSLFYTCNNWTASALKEAGIRTGLWTPLPWGVIW